MTQALRTAADLLDDWAKGEGYKAMVNKTDPGGDAGTRLFATCLEALVCRARADAADFRMRAALADLSPSEGNEP